MSKNLNKIAAVASGLAVACLPMLTFAQEADIFPVASSSAAVTTAYAALGVIISLVIGGVLGAWASLIGLGFATRKATAKVTGKKF